jgi:nucleotide-binding universal stress UspA family protein
VLGSVSAGLLGRSEWPVLVVPDTPGRPPGPPARLLAAVAPGDDEVTRFAVRLAGMLGARPTLAHVVPPPLGGDGAALASPWDPGDAGVRAASAGRTAGVLDLPSAVDLRVLEGDPAPAVLRLADELDSPLIVAGTRGRTGLRGALLGSVSRALIGAGHHPVVVVPTAG